MSSEVYYAQRRATQQGGLLEKLEQLSDAAGFAGLFAPGDVVAVLMPFGEPGNTTALRPAYMQVLLNKLRAYGARPFLTDTLPLPPSRRADAHDALEAAEAHGYGVLRTPLVPADGLRGLSETRLPVDGRHMREAAFAAAIAEADAVLSVRHFTAHAPSGFTGALWNMGVGAASLAGKRAVHETLSPVLVGGDELHGMPAAQALQERLVESAAALLRAKPGKLGYVNLLLDLTPEHDDQGWSDAAIAPDIGILASRDPVAIDQASVDLLNQAPGIAGTRLSDPAVADKLSDLYPDVDWRLQLAYAEGLGLGTRDYELMII